MKNKFLNLLLTSDYADIMFRMFPDDYRERLNALEKKEEEFQALLTPEQQSQYNIISDIQNDVLQMSSDGHFLFGFKFGMNLLLESIHFDDNS